MKKNNSNQNIIGLLFYSALTLFTAPFLGAFSLLFMVGIIVQELGGFAHLGNVLGENVSGAQVPMLSKIITQFDILKPSVRQQLIRRHGNQGINFFALTEALGYSRGVPQRQTKQYEEDWILQPVILGSTVTSSGSNVYTFTLSTTSGSLAYLEQNTTSPYSSALQYVFPVQKANILTPTDTSNAKLWVSSVSISGSTCTVTVTHMNPSTSTFAYSNFSSGSVFIKTGTAYAEGTDIYSSQVNKPIIDYNYTQIIKESFQWSGSQQASQPWFTEYTDDLGNITSYVVVGQNNTEYLQMKNIDDALLFGELTTTSIIDTTSVFGVNNAEPIYTTEGLEPYIKRTGTNLAASYGSFTVTEFDNMDKILDQQGSTQWMCVMGGITFDNEKDNVLKAYFQNNNMDTYYKRMENDLFTKDPGMAMEVGFKCLTKGNRTWCFGRMPQFNMKNSWGEAGLKKDGLALIFPMGSKPDKSNPTNRIPFMGSIYRELGGYSRKAMVWTLNGASGDQRVSSVDRNTLCYLSDIGAEHSAGNMMIRRYIA